ncbi:outer membrane autotransporter [Methylobacterium oryzae]|uniref:Outer membrane autotransporter n=1 Tax=Methylobacterium oryzae TaxID=334852 RepID=A0ABU7TTV4_9HYPH
MTDQPKNRPTMAQDGATVNRSVLTEGYVKRGGLMGPATIPTRPAPPPAFRPSPPASAPAPAAQQPPASTPTPNPGNRSGSR